MRTVKRALYLLLLMLISGIAFSCGNLFSKEKEGLDIYFSSKRDGYYGLYRSDSKEAQLLFNSRDKLQNLHNMAKYQIAYSISHDGDYVAFNALSDELNMDIFLLNLKTGKKWNLTQDSATDTLPVFSHSGEWIAYLSHVKGGRHYDNISLVSKDGKIKRGLTKDFTKIATPSFSPDDSEILFVKYLPFHSAISIVDTETEWVQELTTFACSNQSPSFNGDGTKIVYASDYKGTFDIWVMDRDGSNKRLLYQSPGLEYDPHFTIDGKRVFLYQIGLQKSARVRSEALSYL